MKQYGSIAIGCKSDGSKNRIMDVIAYRRVSGRKQGEKGVSLEDQQNQMDAGEKDKGYDILETLTDVHSARKEQEGCKRSGLNKAMKLALELNVPILVTHASRFTRTYATYKRFEEQGGVLLVASLGMDAPIERVRFAVQDAEEEIEQRRRTTAIGMKRARAEGRIPGNPDLAPAREKSTEVRKALARQGYERFERHLAIAIAGGAQTLREKARALNKAGLKTPQDRKWKAANVKQNVDRLAKLKAAAGNVSATQTGPKRSDIELQVLALQAKFRRASSHESAEPDAKPISEDSVVRDAAGDLSQPNNATTDPAEGCPLSATQLAGFGVLLSMHSTDAEKNKTLFKTAASPTLPKDKRAMILNWMAKKLVRAA